MRYHQLDRIAYGLIGLLFIGLSITSDSPGSVLTALYSLGFFLFIIWPKPAKLIFMVLGLYALVQLILLAWHHPGTDSHVTAVLIYGLFILLSAMLITPNALWQYSGALALFFLSLIPVIYKYLENHELNLNDFYKSAPDQGLLTCFCISGILLSIIYYVKLALKTPIYSRQTSMGEMNLAYFSFDGEHQCFYINADFAILFHLEPYLPIIPFTRMRDLLDENEFHKLERAFNRSYFGHRRLSLIVKLKEIKSHYIQLRANCHGKQLHGIAFDCSKESNQRISLREQNQRLNEIAHFDALTGLLNRYAFQEAATRLLAEAKRHHFKLGWLYLDLDWFKTINDVHGHRIGDLVLQACAQRLRSDVRAEDVLCRLGGDEFFIILNHTHNTLEAIKMGNKLLNTLHKPIVIEGISFNLSASVGVSLFPDDGNQLEQLIEKADDALAEAKKLGKSQVHKKR